MGCVSSCFLVENYENHTSPSSSVNRNCPCPTCLVNNLLNLYISLFRRSETRSLPSSLQATTVVSITSYDNFMSNTFHSTPRPLPYDSDPGYYLRSRRDSLVSRREKGSSHSQEEAEPLRSDADDEDSESFSVEKANGLIKDFSRSTRRVLKSKTIMDAVDQGVYVMSDDEDVCPTCLEEYTAENPKIVTKCSHHYHLSCIYEWMERSQDCPVCGQVMEYNETP
ncbi:hypothetical protein Bca52824_005027 [Brassica carinata]|uniref:RING-type E3 ubiquitin transferase n=1 Tax=Brassica carinata TaxID=52824 RepID=A0A8X8BFY4_BRACI|nr:hypothetical protein Bca52824_005027 [Brassica carinata]